MECVALFRSFVLGAVFSAVAVLAQDSPGGIVVERLIEQTMARNAGLLAARARTGEARGALSQAALRPNPTLDFGFDSGSVLGSSGESEYTVGYSHTLELGGKRGRRIESGTLAVALAEAEAADFERELRWSVRTRFGEALADLERATGKPLF